MINRKPLYFVLTMTVLLSSIPALISCNKDNKDTEEEFTYSTSRQTTLVTGFSLQADAEVLAYLDSVHFTIDYDNGVIYNADSLPKGTNITGLKCSIKFLNTVSSSMLTITGATTRSDTTIEYTAAMNTKLDFTGKTVLKVTSADQSQTKEYNIKVLVHKENPDTLIWPDSWRRELPGYQNNTVGHKAVQMGGSYFIMTYNGVECNVLAADSPNQGTWDKKTINLPFIPQVQSLTAVQDLLYVLSADGTLFFSSNGEEWESCGVMWHSVLGAFGDKLLGIMGDDEQGYYHDQYPRSEGFVVTEVEEGFPVAHASNMIETDNRWTSSQQAMIVGGIDRNGNMLSDVWGYDGTTWGRINNIHSKTMPAIADATLFSYYTYRSLPGVRHYAKQQTWYLMGGRFADGGLNSTIYVSNTQGITWTSGGEILSQPDGTPDFYGAQAIVSNETMTANIGAAPRRVASSIITWDCPYIYLFGGYDEQGKLLPWVWRGVYNRLTHTPVY